MLKVTSLFSGIGGIDLGLKATGYYKTTLFSEIDPFCQKILKKHWPNVPIIPDVRDINGKEIETDVLVGGFPCQPFSVAGKRKGKEDERHLWPEMFRIIKEARPSIVIGENVPGIINTQMALGQCVSDLESEGYKVQPVVLPACSVNAPHRRYRVFIIAMVDTDNLRLPQHSSEEKEKQVGWTETPLVSGSSFMANANSSSRSSWESRGADREISAESEGLRGGESERKARKESWSGSENVANPTSFISNGGGRGDHSKEGEIQREIGRKSSFLANSTASGSQASSEERLEQEGSEEAIAVDTCSRTFRPEGNWAVEPNVGRVADGISDRIHRIKSLGNAVVPQLTYVIGMSIIKAMQDD